MRNFTLNFQLMTLAPGRLRPGSIGAFGPWPWGSSILGECSRPGGPKKVGVKTHYSRLLFMRNVGLV